MKEYTVKQVSDFSGRSVSTIRSWIRSKKLKATRKGSKKNSPLIIKHSDLMNTLHKTGLLEADPKEPISNLSTDSQPDSLKSVEYLERLLSEVTKERDRLIRENEKLQQRLDAEVQHSRSLAERIYALERKVMALGGPGQGRGILGYIESGFKKIFEKSDTSKK